MTCSALLSTFPTLTPRNVDRFHPEKHNETGFKWSKFVDSYDRNVNMSIVIDIDV